MINILLSPILSTLLENKNISYAPAYIGESTGLDFYLASETSITIEPLNKTLIPTGLHIALPSAHTAVILGRGSIHKTNLIHKAGVIDPGYSGEIFISAWNTGAEPITFMPGEKLPWQLVVFQTPNTFNIVDRETFDQLHLNSSRKDGKLGSSNT